MESRCPMKIRPIHQIATARWLLFDVVISILPLVLSYSIRAMFIGNPTIMDVIQNGELYLISTALAAAAIGEVVSKWQLAEADVSLRMFSAFLAILVVFFSLGFYSALHFYSLV